MLTNFIIKFKSGRNLSTEERWTGRELNPRPFGCEPNITTTELPALRLILFIIPDIYLGFNLHYFLLIDLLISIPEK